MLTACLSAVEERATGYPAAGTYQGDHGTMTRRQGLESELILREDGTFRYFFIDSNTAFQTAKGAWSVEGERMEWKDWSRSYLYHGGFRRWDTADAPDTSLLRNVEESGFERMELTYDTLYAPVIRWIRYTRISPEARLPDGEFEFSEAFRDPVDSNLTIRGSTRLEIARDGHYVQKIYHDGEIVMEEVDSLWSQAGTYLITTRNRHCGYEPGYVSCSSAPPEYEYVARLDQVGEDGFSLWIAPDFSYQPGPHWAAFRKDLTVTKSAPRQGPGGAR